MRIVSSGNRRTHSFRKACSAGVLLCLSIVASPAFAAYAGRVLDAEKKTPIADAIVTLGERAVRTDRNGGFEIGGSGKAIGFRAYGHERKWVPVGGLASGPHLHYEFRVQGQHRDPLRVKLPKSLGLPQGELAKFQKTTAPLLAQLEAIPTETLVASAGSSPNNP